ncbi:hypothetical protein CMT52_21110 [Elizabethkingia anophelis]|nr:hypothetical protein [Elizabethkingia anophelis]
MKPTLIILSFLLLLGCRSRKLDRKITTEIKQSYEKVVKEESQNSVVKNTQKTEYKIQDKETEKSQNTNVEIKGKTETGKPFKVHQVENGDTISSIMITGNADFTIKSNSRNSNKKQEKQESKENLNEVQKLARNAVSQSTIKDVANKIKEEAKRVESSGFQFGAYAALIWWGTAAIIVIGLIIYFRKSTFFTTIIDKIKKIKL